MITIVAKTIVKQGSAEEFKALAETLINESRKEEGCKEYNLYQDIHDTRILTFIEQWIDEEAINLHNKSKHFTAIFPELEKLLENPPEVHLYKVL